MNKYLEIKNRVQYIAAKGETIATVSTCKNVI